VNEFLLIRTGAELVDSLERDCGLGSDAARRFIELRTGQPFEAERTYSVGYLAGRNGKNWSRFKELKIWKRSLSDASLS